jgi:hypothetical protein
MNDCPGACRITSTPDGDFTGHQIAMTYSSGTNPHRVADAALIALVPELAAATNAEAAGQIAADLYRRLEDKDAGR